MRGYWFGERLGYGDGRLPRVGRTHRVTGRISLCQRGLHASRHPFDALRYACSNVLWLVDLGGEVIEGGDKIVASERRYIARRNVESMLYSFARAQALSVSHLWDCPEVALEYLETGEESLREAAGVAVRAAAWDAAGAAAWDAAWVAVRAAAWDAAWAAAWAAAGAAAWDAARDAAWAAAGDAAWDAARDDFKLRVEAAFGRALEEER